MLARIGCDVRSIALHDGQRRLTREFLAATAPSEQAADTQEHRRRIVIVDGYEQLSCWSRWRLQRRCRVVGAGLLVTAHGPTNLPSLFRTAVDLELTERVVTQLLADAGPGAETAADISLQDIRWAWQRHNGNLRETLFDLYDIFEQRRIGRVRAAS